MSPQLVELALRKQRLQIRSAALRETWASNVGGIAPLFSAADGIRRAAFWVRSHPLFLVAAGVALVVARPRAVFRWAQRGALTYRLWRMLNQRLHALPGWLR